MHRKNFATIHLDRLRHNLREIRRYSGSSSCCLMIKANAYGHGLLPIALAAEDGVDSFGIISLEEAEVLREGGVRKPLWLFANLWADSIQDLLHHQVTPMIGDFYSLEHFLKRAPETAVFHLKINTGMNRFGFRLEQKPQLMERLQGFFHRIEGVATHMYDGNHYRDATGASAQQRGLFLDFLRDFPMPRLQHIHVYKSGPALLNHPPLVADDPLFTWIRPGIAAYGSLPDKGFSTACDLQPVMELKSHLVCLQEVKRGESVSYSGRWIASQDSLVGVVQIGYADGLLRSLSNKAEFLVAGQRVAQVGNICMDYCMVDLTKVRHLVEIGDPVVIFGQQADKLIAVEELAAAAGTIPYEILTSLAPRVHRVYQEDEKSSCP